MTATTTIAKRVTSQERLDQLKALMVKRTPEFLRYAPRGFDAQAVDRLLAQSVAVIGANPNLLACTPASVFISVRNAAELGLDLAGAMPKAWLVPYKNECKLLIGYQGMIEMAHRSGAVRMIEARIVYEHDEFEIDYGHPTKPITHKPMLRGDRGEIIGAYASAVLAGVDKPLAEWMPIGDIQAIRLRSKSAEKGPWKTDYAEMARKCPVRRIFKYLPTSPAIERMIEIDREADGFDEQVVPASAKTSNTDRIAEALGISSPKPELDTSTAQDEPLEEPTEINEDDIPF